MQAQTLMAVLLLAALINKGTKGLNWPEQVRPHSNLIALFVNRCGHLVLPLHLGHTRMR